MWPERLGVVGLGALGGSLAWQAARRLGSDRVIGWSRAPRESVAAVRCGAISAVARDVIEVAARSDFVVLADSPRYNRDALERLATGSGSGIVTDISGVKSEIVDQAETLGLGTRFCGSHPLCETVTGGFAGARSNLFDEAVVYVTPAAGGEAAADEVEDFWTRVLDARPVRLSAARHDRIVAGTLHLPHAVAAALANSLAVSTAGGATVPTAALDASRIAAAEVDTWCQVMLANRTELLRELSEFEDLVRVLREALEQRDAEAVRAFLTTGACFRRRFE